jgi:cell division protein FtsB
MARNRKNFSAAVRFGPAINALLLCLVIGGAGVGYVWQKKRIHDLAQQIEQREIRFKKLQEQNAKLNKQLATLRSPPFLQARATELKLGLGPPQAAQIVRMVEIAPAPETPRLDDGSRTGEARTPSHLYAGRGSGGTAAP